MLQHCYGTPAARMGVFSKFHLPCETAEQHRSCAASFAHASTHSGSEARRALRTNASASKPLRKASSSVHKNPPVAKE